MSRESTLVNALVVACALAWSHAFGAPQAKPATDTEARTFTAFGKSVNAYVDIHKKIESTLPNLPKEASTAQIDNNQRDLARLIVAARPNARRGEVFGPEMEAFIHRLMVSLLAGKDGALLKASIMDENPQGIACRRSWSIGSSGPAW
jgi:hypothetical protein